MARQQRVYTATFSADVAIVTTGETVVATIVGIPVNLPAYKVTIFGWVELLIGTGGTAVTLRIRETDLIGGTAIGDATVITIGSVAGVNEVYSKVTSENRTVQGLLAYNMTVTVANATGNSTAVQGALTVIVE